MSHHSRIDPDHQQQQPADAEARITTDPSDPLLPENALVPVGERADGWTPERQRAFIEALANHGSVRSAALSVGMSPQSAYRLRRRADAAAFDAAWEAALERVMDHLVTTAMDRALNGTLRTRWYRGEVVAEETVHSDRLLLYMLGRGRDLLRRKAERAAFASNWEGALEQVGEDVAPAEEVSRWFLRRNGMATGPPTVRRRRAFAASRMVSQAIRTIGAT